MKASKEYADAGIYSQHGEEHIINMFFQEKRAGMCVDIGAADGVINSNSRFLIEMLGWSAVLIEPHPSFYSQLEKLYSKNK